jgi:hypothetical protein
MKILVPAKRVVDYTVKIRVKADGSGVELANIEMSMNPFDEIAVKEAIRLKDSARQPRSWPSRLGGQARTLARILKAKGLFPVTIPPLPRL